MESFYILGKFVKLAGPPMSVFYAAMLSMLLLFDQ